MIEEILQKAQREPLNEKEALMLLKVPTMGKEYYQILQAANCWARDQFEEKGKIFAQIGIDYSPCSVDCAFCSMAKSVVDPCKCGKKSINEVVEQAKELVHQGVDDIFLMTTADFSQQEFLEYGKAVKDILPSDVRLVANIGDFSLEYAQKLKAVGFTGVYHICRLGEGIDTKVQPETRIALDSIKKAGLGLYYCVEPIGPEHTNEQLVQEMLRVREYLVGVMAVMKRVAVPGTPLANRGEVSAARLAQICAVTTLTAHPERAMCVHEPDELCLMAGANQLYAEVGINPRDLEKETAKGRGFSVQEVKKMLWNTHWNWSGNR